MKILHVIPNLKIGGAQRLLENMVLQVKKEKDIEIEIIVFKLYDTEIEKNLINHGVKINSLGVSMRSPLAIPKLRHFIAEANIIHSHLFPANYYTVVANLGLNKPHVFTEHSTHNKRRDHKFLRPVEKFIYSKFDIIAAISEETKKNLLSWIGDKYEKNLKVIENGIVLEDYFGIIPYSQKEIFGREGVPILMVSRFTKSKDHETLVKSLNYIEDSSVFLVFAGEGETLPQIKRLVKELNLEERVIFLGNRNDIPKIIGASKIGVQSSNWEGFGLTAIELMAGGLPVIASDVDGLKQVVEGAGIIFEKGNSEMLANSIQKLVYDNSFYLEIVEKCKKRALNYSITHTTSKYLNTYNDLIRKS